MDDGKRLRELERRVQRLLRYVEAQQGAILLEHLPAYAPELNPAEYLPAGEPCPRPPALDAAPASAGWQQRGRGADAPPRA